MRTATIILLSFTLGGCFGMGSPHQNKQLMVGFGVDTSCFDWTVNEFKWADNMSPEKANECNNQFQRAKVEYAKYLTQ